MHLGKDYPLWGCLVGVVWSSSHTSLSGKYRQRSFSTRSSGSHDVCTNIMTPCVCSFSFLTSSHRASVDLPLENRALKRGRSYFKCQKAGCNAKKRAEWSETEPGDLRVVYEGVHNHGSSQDQSGSSQSGASNTSANQYNLLNQVFGDNPPSDYRRSGD
ncbi:hypothetical protein BT93_C1410 [Corymbia citriodora subsp. variegata]|nr:hypothetical protein BT93_C1410 [Corymbia citriodora subsp. variegata]KAF8035374.1 hypothetical protein BT93_C1410 [Corymbia citriodora subsp. variegata]